jgi:hypothetical protein
VNAYVSHTWNARIDPETDFVTVLVRVAGPAGTGRLARFVVDLNLKGAQRWIYEAIRATGLATFEGTHAIEVGLIPGRLYTNVRMSESRSLRRQSTVGLRARNPFRHPGLDSWPLPGSSLREQGCV